MLHFTLIYIIYYSCKERVFFFNAIKYVYIRVTRTRSCNYYWHNTRMGMPKYYGQLNFVQVIILHPRPVTPHGVVDKRYDDRVVLCCRVHTYIVANLRRNLHNNIIYTFVERFRSVDAFQNHFPSQSRNKFTDYSYCINTHIILYFVWKKKVYYSKYLLSKYFYF